MKHLFILSFCLVLSSLAAQLKPTLWQINNNSIKEWYYHFGDEFTDERLDESKWYNHYPWGGLSIKDGIYAAPEMVSIENGKAILTVDTSSDYRTFPEWMLEEDIKNKNPLVQNNRVKLNYLTAALWSKLSFRYGYFECRCFIPKGQGLWPAFWLYGGKPNDEIDFMESKGEKTNEFHVDIHCPDACDKIKPFPYIVKKPWGAWLKTDRSLMGEWIVFSGIWLPGYVNFYMNGKPVANYVGDFGAEMNMIANLSVAVDKGPFSPGPNKKTAFPSEFLVDYMRVWKLADKDMLPANQQKNFTEGDLLNIGPLLALDGSEKVKLKGKNKRTLPKSLLENEQGFISLMPINEKLFQLHLNGISGEGTKIQVLNENDAVVKSFDLNEKYHFFSMDDFQNGNYRLVISNGAGFQSQLFFTNP